MRILVALLAVLAGLALIFGGYRIARFVIPLWGFIAGLMLGGAIISDMNSTPFLGTVLGVTIGILAGLLFAVLAYLYYYVAVVVMTASLGYWAGSSLIQWFGFSPGVLSTIIGIAAGIVAGFAAVFANVPKYLLIVLTSVAGAVATVGGILLLFNQIPLNYFSYTTAHIAISNSFFWTLVALALTIVGIIVQARSTSQYYLEEWGMHGDETHHHIPTTHVPAH